MKDFGDYIKNLFANKEGGRTVERTVAMHPDWIKKLEELTAVEKKAEELLREREHLKELLWVTIRGDLKCYNDMHMDSKRKIIEIYAPEEDDA